MLPLSKNIPSIAIIGPSADVPRFGDYAGPGVQDNIITLYGGIANLVSSSTIVKLEWGTGIQSDYEMQTIRPSYLFSASGQPGLDAQYYNNINFTGTPAITRVDLQADFQWCMFA